MTDAEKLARLEEVVSSLRDEFENLKLRKEGAHDEIYRRLRDVERDVAVADKQREIQYQNIEKQLAEIKEQQKQIREILDARQQIPAKRWDTAVASLISSGVGALMGYIMAKLFGGQV